VLRAIERWPTPCKSDVMSLAARTKVTLLFLSASLVGALVGCSQKSEAVTSAHSATTEAQPDFDPNDVLDDSSMTDTTMTAKDVQAFLDRTPYGKRSVLATYKPTKTKTAAQIIAQAALRYEINPMLLLVRAQLESELISKTTATDTVLARAFGCGCATSTATGSASGSTQAVCSPTAQARGFENQATCAALQLRTSLDRLTGKTKGAHPTTDGTTKGWATNERHTTRDGIEVIPDNDATAVLYAYKPWVGKLGNGDPAVGGMSAHARLWADFNASTANATQAGTELPETPATDPTPRPGATSSCTTECTGGSVCDEPSGTCVECAASDLSNCQEDGAGAACIAGRCGCEITADCGSGQGRICDRLHGVCIDGPTGSTGTPPSSDPSDADAGKPATTPTDVPTQDDPLPSDPTTSPTPDLPASDTSSKDSKRAADDKIEVPSSDSSGCTTARSGLGAAAPGRGSGSLVALGLALTAAQLRRRRAPSA
jgi:hypothetical protein